MNYDIDTENKKSRIKHKEKDPENLVLSLTSCVSFL